MSAIRVLIADQNEAFRENLAALLQVRFTVYTSGDGKEALGMLEQLRPDILVMDLMLPGIDGFFVLDYASRLPNAPEVLIITRHLSAYVQEKALSAGVHSMLRKPCDLMAAEANVRAIANRLPDAVLQREMAAVSDLLLRLGFQSHRHGYNQLVDIIPRFSRDPGQPVNKVIYSAVAKKFGLSGVKPVERSVRVAIEDYWNHGDTALWNYLFPPESLAGRKAPTSKQFIARITEYLYREQGIK